MFASLYGLVNANRLRVTRLTVNLPNLPANRTGIRVLNNEKVDVRGLQIVGVHDGETRDPAQFRAPFHCHR